MACEAVYGDDGKLIAIAYYHCHDEECFCGGDAVYGFPPRQMNPEDFMPDEERRVNVPRLTAALERLADMHGHHRFHEPHEGDCDHIKECCVACVAKYALTGSPMRCPNCDAQWITCNCGQMQSPGGLRQALEKIRNMTDGRPVDTARRDRINQLARAALGEDAS